ncbi:MAG: AAA family ATPase [Cystobacter sp.]
MAPTPSPRPRNSSRDCRARRLTLLGPNGSGKSTLLLLLKEQLGTQAVYLPPQNTLEFKQGTDSLSTGQRLLASIDELLKEGQARVLLLDEWDANLDSANEKRVSTQLAHGLGQGLLILEVRHRRAAVLPADKPAAGT